MAGRPIAIRKIRVDVSEMVPDDGRPEMELGAWKPAVSHGSYYLAGKEDDVGAVEAALREAGFRAWNEPAGGPGETAS